MGSNRNWAAWNVALWVNNDETLYRMALRHARRRTRSEAARAMLDELHEAGLRKTPDGATYTISAIKAAMAGM